MDHESGTADEMADKWIEAVMDEYGDRLLKLALSYLKDKGRAQEVVQDVFLVCYQKYDELDSIRAFKPWIYKVTINRCKDQLKMPFFQRVIVDSRLLGSRRAKGLSPEAEFLRQATRSSLVVHLLELPVSYREVLILFYYEQLSVNEIGTVLELNVNTVKTRLRRGRELLGKELEGGGFHD